MKVFSLFGVISFSLLLAFGCSEDGSSCTPNCGERLCGPVPNGCGVSCGSCEDDLECYAGECVDPCSVPSSEQVCYPEIGPGSDVYFLDSCGQPLSIAKDCPDQHSQCVTKGTNNWPACECIENWTGENCDQCAEGWIGEDCNQCEPHYSKDCVPQAGEGADVAWVDFCGNQEDIFEDCPDEHSRCVIEEPGVAACQCLDHWAGEICDQCDLGWVGENCDQVAPGYLKWSYSTGLMVSSPALDETGNVYVISASKNLLAIDANGNLKWEKTTVAESDWWSSSSPSLDENGIVYMGSKDKNIYALNSSDGSIKWSFLTEGYVYATAALGVDGIVYMASQDGYFYALLPDGNLKWKYLIGEWSESSAAVSPNTTLYVGGSALNNLYEFDADGLNVWTYSAKNKILSSPALDLEGNIYFGSYDFNLYVVKPDGSLKWSYKVGGQIFSSPVLGNDGTVYVGSLDGNIYAIMSDGSLKWSFTTEDYVFSSPALAMDGTVYIGSCDDYLYALHADGSLKWRFKTGADIFSSAAIGDDGTVYLGAGDGNLYAIASDSGGLADSPWPKFRQNNKNTGRR